MPFNDPSEYPSGHLRITGGAEVVEDGQAIKVAWIWHEGGSLTVESPDGSKLYARVTTAGTAFIPGFYADQGLQLRFTGGATGAAVFYFKP